MSFSRWLSNNQIFDVDNNNEKVKNEYLTSLAINPTDLQMNDASCFKHCVNPNENFNIDKPCFNDCRNKSFQVQSYVFLDIPRIKKGHKEFSSGI